jgi:hypothetical protein
MVRFQVLTAASRKIRVRVVITTEMWVYSETAWRYIPEYSLFKYFIDLRLGSVARSCVASSGRFS